jgi:predicted nucleotidyltransferase component of viral defense system
MNSTPDLKTAAAWLTPLQLDFLHQFFASSVGADFFLTGGTALAAFYLQHRHSDDLDLFTLESLPLRESGRLMPQLAQQLSKSEKVSSFQTYLPSAPRPRLGDG